MSRRGGGFLLFALLIAGLVAGSAALAGAPVASSAAVEWPGAGGWEPGDVGSPSANLVVAPGGVSMTPPVPSSEVSPSVIATGLDTPWSLRFAPDGRLFITERPGRVRVIENGVLLPEPVLTIEGTETISAEEGLQGMALDPDFAVNGWMYIYYTYSSSTGAMRNRVARVQISGNSAVGFPVTLIDAIPGNRFHNGGRIAFGPDGKLYVAVGSADVDAAAQDLSSLAGKILRINPDGSIPADNPFPGSPVYSYGHRNPQGLAWNPVTGDLWSTEHGPTGTPPFCCHDEINVIRPGGNYGWPRYYGSLTASKYADLPVADPIFPVWESGDGKWAPGGAMFYTGDQLAGPWADSLLFAGLGMQNAGGRALYRLGLGADSATPTGLDNVLEGWFGRLRDLTQGPDGSIYVATSNRDGRGQPIAEDDRVVRLAPSFDPATFTLSYDAGVGTTADWTDLVADADLPAGTSIRYETRSSIDGVTWSEPAEGVATTPSGRHLRVDVTLSTTRAGVPPTLRSLRVSHDLTTVPPGGVFCTGSTAAICEAFDTSAGTFAPAGGAWAVSGGRYVLSAPVTGGSDVVKNRAIHGTPIGGDFAISVRARPTPSASTTNDVAIIFGYQNASNYWSLSLAENNNTANHGLFRVVNNVATQVADITATNSRIVDDTDYRLRLERTGDTLRAYRNDVLVLTRTQSGLPASGRVGVGSINDPASFDEFTARVIPPPPPFCTGSTATVCEDFSAGAARFTTTGGAWGISGGRYTLTGPATSGIGVFNRAIHSATIAGDFTMRASFRPTAASSTYNDVAMIFAYANPTNYWFVSLAENNSTGNHGVFRVANGVMTQVVDLPSTARLVDGTAYDLRLQRTGDLLRVFRNNVQIGSTTQAGLPASGRIGVGSINDPASFDDLVVTQP